MLIAEIRPFSNGFSYVGGRGGFGRGKCTGKKSSRGSDVSEVPAALLCMSEVGFKESVTELALLVHRPSPLFLEFNYILIEVISINLSPGVEVILT